MAKKELLLGAVAASLIFSGAAAPAFAAKDKHRHGHRHGAMIERLDTDKDGKVSLAEFKANASVAFKAFDADGNGQVTKDEIKARREAFKEARKAVHDAAKADRAKAREALRAGGPYMLPGAGRMFEKADTDKNGTLSEAEVLAVAEKAFERRDTNKDGAIDTADARPGKKGKGHHGKDGGKRAERMLERLDTDKDGKISQAEMLARATQTFQRLDTDGNGEVTKAEVDAKREAFREARKAFRAVKAKDGEAKDAARKALREARINRGGMRMFERADADKNGTLTKAEMETAAIAMFKKRDRNGDGFITPDEMGKRGDK